MPNVVTSASTGSRVLHKPTSGSDSGATTPTGSINGGSSRPSSSYFTSQSNASQSKMRRFPSLLSSKNKDTGSAGDGSAAASSGIGKHRASQSMSSSGTGAGAAGRRSTSTTSSGANNHAGDGTTATMGHSRSVSLAAAPSGLPRPTTASTVPSLPTTASQPVMPRSSNEISGAATSTTAPSGIPQAKRVAPPSTSTVTPPENSTSSTTPSRIPALATSSTSPVNRGGGSTTAGQFTAPSINGTSKAISEASPGYRTASQFSSPNSSMQSPVAGSTEASAGAAIVPDASETPTKTATAGVGMGIPRSTSGLPSTGSSGIPRLRNISEGSGSAGSTAAGLTSPARATGNRSGTATPPSGEAGAGAAPITMYPRSREPSGAATSRAGSVASEGAGSRISTARGPLPSVPAPAVSTQQASDNTVPAMWRTSSYEGSTKAYLSTSASMSRSASSSSQGQSMAGQPGHYGLEGLQALEAKYLSSNTEASSSPMPPTNGELGSQSTPAVQHRIRLVRKLVDIRGARILQGVDVEKIIWLDGTNLHLTTDQELAMARNGSIITTASTNPGSSPLPVASANGSPSVTQGSQPQATLPPVPSSPTPAKKQGLFHKMAASFGGGGSGHARKASTGSALSESGESKRGRLVSGTAPLQEQSPSKSNVATSAGKQKSQGPVFGVRIADAPPLAYAVSIIGGQRHQLPILVFSLVEAIFRRGIDTSGIFRMNGDAAAISRLVQLYNTYPSYGDDVNLENETIFTLCDLLKRYLKDMPEAVLPTSLWNVFVASCLHETGGDAEKEHVRKLAAAQIIFRLLPRKNTSLLIYLTAFLFQLPLHASNRLTIDSIAVIFGPAILAPRAASTSPYANIQDSDTKRSQEGLKWLLDNWDDSLSQDLLDEEYDPLATPDLSGSPWTAGQVGEGIRSDEASSEEPKLQHSPQKTAFLESSSPAMSMAAPMMPSFTQQTTQTMESDPERSPVPEGWGEAISPTEDAAILQRQMLSSKPRKSSHDIDPAYPSPTKSEFGLLPARPLSTVDQTDEEQTVATEMPELAATSPAREASPDKPHSLKTTKSSRSLKDVSADQSMPAKEIVSIPGALPLPTSTPLETPAYYQALSNPEPVPAEHADRVRQPSDTNEMTQSDSETRPGASDYTISARDSQSTKTSFPVHSRKESLRSEEGRSSGSASHRNAHLLMRITAFGGLRSSSYGGRPNSYARSDAQFSETGYVPEEITADPNAAKLFGSLGELFVAERRRAVEYQNQLRQLEARTSSHEEHIGNLQRELEEKEGHASRVAEELRAVQSRSQQHENHIREATQQRDELQHQHRELQSSYEGLQTRHKDLENTHQQLRTTANSLEEKLEHEVQERERLLTEAREAQNQERRALVAEISALREQVETHGRERDLARKQLAQIKALLDPSP